VTNPILYVGKLDDNAGDDITLAEVDTRGNIISWGGAPLPASAEQGAGSAAHVASEIVLLRNTAAAVAPTAAAVAPTFWGVERVNLIEARADPTRLRSLLGSMLARTVPGIVARRASLSLWRGVSSAAAFADPGSLAATPEVYTVHEEPGFEFMLRHGISGDSSFYELRGFDFALPPQAFGARRKADNEWMLGGTGCVDFLGLVWFGLVLYFFVFFFYSN
jgi:hypothetical protein